MNISELRQYKNVDDVSLSKLDLLCKKTGNCAMSGYLETSLIDCSFDENGLLEFTSSKKSDDVSVDSIGCVLDNGVLIKQVQKSPVSDYNKLYSWNVDEGVYTYLEFDNKKALNNFYSQIKRVGVNLCDEDLSTALKSLGLSFDNVTKVLVRQKVDPISVMLDEEMDSADNNSLKI